MTGKILELSFQQDQHSLCGGTTLLSVDAPLSPPHWTSGGLNKAVSFDRGVRMSVQVKIQVSPINTKFRLFGISKRQSALNFEFGPLVAMPLPQVVTLRSKAPLPMDLVRMHEYITWNIVPLGGKEEWVNIGQTGEHTIYVTFDKPIANNSMGYANQMTVPRMEFIYNAAASATSIKSPTNLAAAIEWAVNALPNIGKGRPNIDYTVRESVNFLWSLGDSNTKAHGHCGEASYLMEQALRMIGIPAIQKHVHASTDTNVLHAGRNVIYEDEATHKTVGMDINPQTRICKQHGEEKLSLMFNRVNDGEGTVEVGGKLYGGLLNEIADSQGGTSAAHQMLLQLQNKGVYQVWSSEKSGACTSSPEESGVGPAKPSVPPA